MPIVEYSLAQSNPADAETMCILPPSILSDPFVRLGIEIKAAYVGGRVGNCAPTMHGLRWALRYAAARLELPDLPPWWASVPSTPAGEWLTWCYRGESDDDPPLLETFWPHVELRELIDQTVALLLAEDAAELAATDEEAI